MSSLPLESITDKYARFSKHFDVTPKLHRRTVLVTGASRGIGLAIAFAFGIHRAKDIFLVGRNEESLLEAAELVSKGCREDQSVHVKVGDVKDREFWLRLRKEKLLAGIDILVNAAGLAHSSRLVISNPELLENVVQTNLMGTMWGCQIMSKVMLKQERASTNTGCIINVASLLAIKGAAGAAAYAASKAGVLGLTRAVACEMGAASIRVNAIVPGYIKTAMTDGMLPDARARALKSIPQERFGTCEEVADAAIFLAANEYANNCVLNLDGGLSAT